MLGGISIESTADDEQKERPGRGGRFPQIHTAMQNLRQAAQQLEKAENIYGGPRAKALDLAKQAEHELREAIEFARSITPLPERARHRRRGSRFPLMVADGASAGSGAAISGAPMSAEETPMSDEIRQVDSFYVQVSDKPGEGAKALGTLRDAGVNLLAFSGFKVLGASRR